MCVSCSYGNLRSVIIDGKGVELHTKQSYTAWNVEDVRESVKYLNVGAKYLSYNNHLQRVAPGYISVTII